MSCSTCSGVYHPATGHAFTENVVLCGICAGRFWAWVVHWTKKHRGPSFYEAAATSIKP